MTPLDIQAIRAQFPTLHQTVDGRPDICLDNPAGTQVPQSVIDAISDYLLYHSANHGGAFARAQRSDDILHEAHAAMADFLNAASADEIVFGPNMTTLTFSISRALGRTIHPGDEIIVTRMDHDANITPWVMMAEDRGAIVRWADFDVEDYTLDMAQLRSLINERTKIVAVGYASNALGTINDVATITRWAHEVGALAFVDAVQYAPHGPIDVQALGCDLLACSAYKFFSAHVGILYGRIDLLTGLQAYKVRPATNKVPGKFETGTQNHEGMAGVLAAVNYLADIGKRYGQDYITDFPTFNGRRLHLKTGMAAIEAYDRVLSAALIAELQTLPGLRIHGITDPARLHQRVATVSFTWGERHPRAIAEHLAAEGISVWDGNYYALAVTERLDLENKGGMVRVGPVHYNTVEEIEKLGAALRKLV